MKRKISWIFILFILVIAGCKQGPTGQIIKDKPIYSFDETLAEFETLDAKYNTSFFKETMKTGLDLDTINEMRADIFVIRDKVAEGKSNSEKEYESIKSFINFRLHLLDTRENYVNYYNNALGKPNCSDMDKMYETLYAFERAINETVIAGAFWDRSLNIYEPARKRLSGDNISRPEFFEIPLWKMRIKVDEYRAVIKSYCPSIAAGEAIEIKSEGTIK